MYWNNSIAARSPFPNGLTLTWDVLKFVERQVVNSTVEININMRCIEMEEPEIENSDNIGLTLTWDVLK